MSAILVPLMAFWIADCLDSVSSDPAVNVFVGIAAACFPLGQFLSGWLWGSLSDRLRRRRSLLLWGSAINIVIYGAMAFLGTEFGAGTVAVILVLRFVAGLSNGNIGIARACMSELAAKVVANTGNEANEASRNSSSVNSNADSDSSSSSRSKISSGKKNGNVATVPTSGTLESRQRQVYSLLTVTFITGLAAGPLIGGALAGESGSIQDQQVHANLSGPSHDGPMLFQSSLHPLRYAAPCFVSVMLSLLTLVATLFALEETHPEASSYKGQEKSNENSTKLNETKDIAPRNRSRLSANTLIMVSMNGLMGAAYASVEVLFPLLAKDPPSLGGLSFGASFIGYANGIGGVVGGVFQIFLFASVAQWMGSTMKTHALMYSMASVVVAVFPTIRYAYAYPTTPALWCWVGLVESAKAIFFSSSFATIYLLVSQSASRGDMARVNGIAQSLNSLGRGIGAAVFGALYASVSSSLGKNTAQDNRDDADMSESSWIVPFIPFWTLAGFMAITLIAFIFLTKRYAIVPTLQAVVTEQIDDSTPLLANIEESVANEGDSACLSRSEQHENALPSFKSSASTESEKEIKINPISCSSSSSDNNNNSNNNSNNNNNPTLSQTMQDADAVLRSVHVKLADVNPDSMANDFVAFDEKYEKNSISPGIKISSNETLPHSQSGLNGNVANENKDDNENNDASMVLALKFCDFFDARLRYHGPDATDRWHAEGREFMAAIVVEFVKLNQRINMVLPAFPCKSPNTKEKVLGILPDRAEEAALERLEAFCADVALFYPPGCDLVILSDGRVFADLVGVPDERVSLYGEELRRMASSAKHQHLLFDSLDRHCAPGSPDDVRQELITRSGLTMEELENLIGTHDESWQVCYGFMKFLQYDRTWDAALSKNKVKKECAKIAKQMMARNVAFSRLCQEIYPRHVRLSIHGHTNAGPKFAILLFSSLKTPATPWHNVVLRCTNGDELLLRRDAMESLLNESGREADLEYCYGRPWMFIEKKR